MYLSFYRLDYLFDTSPLIGILGAASDHAKALQDVNDVINSPPFDSQLPSTLVQKEDPLSHLPIRREEPFTEFPKTFFLARVARNGLFWGVFLVRFEQFLREQILLIGPKTAAILPLVFKQFCPFERSKLA